MTARAEPAARQVERDWWRRALTVLWKPREAFQALGDDSPQAAASRQEPVTALVFLSGISIFLSTRTAAHFLDQSEFDSVDVLFEAFVGGVLIALQNFWVVGGTVYLGARGRDSDMSYRQGRHLLALALAPFALSLVLVWPVRVGVYGSDLFRSGGADEGTGGAVFRGLDGAFLLWALILLLLGVRTVNRWKWGRSLTALGLAGVFVALLVALAIVA